MDVIESKKGEGYKPYYTHKIENLQVIISEKMQDLRRLQAQRNELNAKGELDYLLTCLYIYLFYYLVLLSFFYFFVFIYLLTSLEGQCGRWALRPLAAIVYGPNFTIIYLHSFSFYFFVTSRHTWEICTHVMKSFSYQLARERDSNPFTLALSQRIPDKPRELISSPQAIRKTDTEEGERVTATSYQAIIKTDTEGETVTATSYQAIIKTQWQQSKEKNEKKWRK